MGSFGLLSSASNSCVNMSNSMSESISNSFVNMSNSMSEITEDGMGVIFLLNHFKIWNIRDGKIQ